MLLLKLILYCYVYYVLVSPSKWTTANARMFRLHAQYPTYHLAKSTVRQLFKNNTKQFSLLTSYSIFMHQTIHILCFMSLVLHCIATSEKNEDVKWNTGTFKKLFFFTFYLNIYAYIASISTYSISYTVI